MQAREVFKAVPKGNYVIIKGNKADANADFLRSGHGRDHRCRREVGRHQDRRRDLHRQLGSVEGPDRDGAVPDRERTTRSTPFSPRTTAWPVASSPRSRPRAWPARCRCRVRTATRPRSTASRSARRRSTSGRTPASSARPPAKPRSQLCANPDVDQGQPAPRRSRRPVATTSTSILLKPIPITKDNLKRRPRRRLDRQGQRSARASRPVPSPVLRLTPATDASDRCARASLGARALLSVRGQPSTRGVTMTEAPTTPAIAPATDPAGRSWRDLVASTEIDTRLLGMVVRARRHLDRLPRHVARRLPDVAQPVEPVGPERVHRDHGDGHGAHHRVAQHRPVGRVAARVPRLHDGDGAGRSGSRTTLRPRASTSRTPGSSPWPSASCSAR